MIGMRSGFIACVMLLLLGCQDERAVFEEKFVANCTYGAEYGEHSGAVCKCLAELYVTIFEDKELGYLNSGCTQSNAIECMAAHRKFNVIQAEMKSMHNPSNNLSNDFVESMQACVAHYAGYKGEAK